MRALRRVLFAVTGVVTTTLVTGCIQSGSYVLQRSNDGVVAMTPVGCSQVQVDKLTVVRSNGGGEVSYIWAIERIGGENVEQEAFTIGLLPSGYVETKPFKPELLTDDAKISFDVEPSGSLAYVRFGDIPSDNHPYLVEFGTAPRRLSDRDSFIASYRDGCHKTWKTNQLVAAIVIILGVSIGYVILAWNRRVRPPV